MHMVKKPGFLAHLVLGVVLLAGGHPGVILRAQSTQGTPAAAPAQAPAPASRTSAPATNPKTAGAPVHYHPDRFAGRAGKYYELIWGIDSLA
jgi:hypothetical protein